MDEFLGISERITTIRALLGPNAGLLNSSSTVPTSGGTSSGSGSTGNGILRQEQLGSPIGGNYEAVKRADEDLILSPEIAEQVWSLSHFYPLIFTLSVLPYQFYPIISFHMMSPPEIIIR